MLMIPRWPKGLLADAHGFGATLHLARTAAGRLPRSKKSSPKAKLEYALPSPPKADLNQEIEDSNYLPGYRVNLHLTDSGCDEAGRRTASNPDTYKGLI